MNENMVLLMVAIALETIAAFLRKNAKPLVFDSAFEISFTNRVMAALEDEAGDEPDPDVMTFDGQSLRWNGHSWPATSGPHGKGALPPGEYGIDWKHCTEDPSLTGGYRLGDVAFWIPLVNSTEADAVGRGHFGIHPDGSGEGTSGCIGISTEAAATEFWTMKAMWISERPQRLKVWQPCWEKPDGCPV